MNQADNKIIVSVLCMAYNHELYIRDALEGFVTQKTNFCYEVFVHDDASTDNTASIIMEYAEKYPNIIIPIIQTENQHSKNVSIQETYFAPRIHGKYIAMCEGDDYWTSVDKLQRQVDFLESHPEYSACVHETLSKNQLTGQDRYINGGKIDKDISFIEVAQGGNACFQLSSLMYRREYFTNRPEFFEISKGYYGDYPLAMYLTLMGKVFYLKDCMSVYRLFSQGSWTSRNGFNAASIIKCRNIDIALLKAVDEYSNYEYSDEIIKIIRRKEYDIFQHTKISEAVLKFPIYKYLEFYARRFWRAIKRLIKKYLLQLYNHTDILKMK